MKNYIYTALITGSVSLKYENLSLDKQMVKCFRALDRKSLSNAFNELWERSSPSQEYEELFLKSV